jgi:hypothetical protein
MTMWHRPILPLGSSLGACEVHKVGRAEYATRWLHGTVFGSGLAAAHARQLKEAGANGRRGERANRTPK